MIQTALNVPPDFDRFIESLISTYHPDQVILFGSRARNESNEDSDVDLLVVMEHEQKKNVYMAADIATDLHPRFPMDLLVRKPSDIEARLSMGDQFIREIFRDGIILHGEPTV